MLARLAKRARRRNQQRVQFAWQENLQQKPIQLIVFLVSVVNSKNLQTEKNVFCAQEAGQRMMLQVQHVFNVKNDGAPRYVRIQGKVVNFVYLAFLAKYSHLILGNVFIVRKENIRWKQGSNYTLKLLMKMSLHMQTVMIVPLVQRVEVVLFFGLRMVIGALQINPLRSPNVFIHMLARVLVEQK